MRYSFQAFEGFFFEFDLVLQPKPENPPSCGKEGGRTQICHVVVYERAWQDILRVMWEKQIATLHPNYKIFVEDEFGKFLIVDESALKYQICQVCRPNFDQSLKLKTMPFESEPSFTQGLRNPPKPVKWPKFEL